MLILGVIMLKELITLANHLDLKGFAKEANYIDELLRKQADPFSDMNDAFADMDKPKLPKPGTKEECKDYAEKADDELKTITDMFKRMDVFSKYHIANANSTSYEGKGLCDIVFEGSEGKIIFTDDYEKYTSLCGG